MHESIRLRDDTDHIMLSQNKGGKNAVPHVRLCSATENADKYIMEIRL